MKTAIRREEELFRMKTSEALAMKADFKRRQVEIQMLITDGIIGDCDQHAGEEPGMDGQPAEPRLDEIRGRISHTGARVRKI